MKMNETTKAEPEKTTLIFRLRITLPEWRAVGFSNRQSMGELKVFGYYKVKKYIGITGEYSFDGEKFNKWVKKEIMDLYYPDGLYGLFYVQMTRGGLSKSVKIEVTEEEMQGLFSLEALHLPKNREIGA